MASAHEEQWRVFQQAAEAFPDLLFIVPGADVEPGRVEAPLWPAAFNLPNVLAVGIAGVAQAATSPVSALIEGSSERIPSPTDGRTAVIVAADALAGCWPQLVQAYKGAALKAALLAEAAKRRPEASLPVIEACP